MKVIVAGSREGVPLGLVTSAIDAAHEFWPITEIVSGTARGVDRWGEDVAKDLGIPVKRFPADWTRHGKAAGHIRNGEMADYADALIVIHNNSSGSLNMKTQMLEREKPVFEIIIQLHGVVPKAVV